MYTLSVHTANKVVDYPLREKSLKNIKINSGGAANWVIATPTEFYSVPSNQMWCVKEAGERQVSSIEVIRENVDLEELEALARLLREGLNAERCPFTRTGTAKTLLSKINGLIKEKSGTNDPTSEEKKEADAGNHQAAQ